LLLPQRGTSASSSSTRLCSSSRSSRSCTMVRRSSVLSVRLCCLFWWARSWIIGRTCPGDSKGEERKGTLATVQCCDLDICRNTTKDVFPVRVGADDSFVYRYFQSLGGDHLKKLVRILAVPAFTVVAQVALATSPASPPPPQPPPPILRPHPGPSGPVDPTPVQPPVS
jgi:hypothetical protein